jgi:flagellar hook-length control protein FliK
MLATLNLQLSPVELLDDSTLTPVSLSPGETGESASGFADLLQLRVDASLLVNDTGGELLPQGGNELPIITELVLDETTAATMQVPALDAGLVKLAPAQNELLEGLASSTPADEAVDLILESPVLYPPATAATDANPESLTLAPIPTGALLQATLKQEPARAEAGIEGGRGGAIERPLNLNIGPSTPVAPPVVEGREVEVRSPAAGASVLAAAGLGARERGQEGEPTRRAGPITLPNTALDADNRASLTELARRMDLTATQRSEPIADALQTKFNLAQASQNLQAPTSPLPAQSTLSLSAAAASADLGYTAAAQQSTDLIGTSVRDRGWGEQVGERVVMMAANQLKQADIRLTPAELGPLRVRVSVDDGNAHVTFHAQHAVTREALEQALPRLREMLAENGLTLGQADVSDRGVADGDRDGGSQGESGNAVADDLADADLATATELTSRVKTSNGLVDTFV